MVNVLVVLLLTVALASTAGTRRSMGGLVDLRSHASTVFVLAYYRLSTVVSINNMA